MRLYHGGSSIIEHPDCRIGRDNLDFGKGFLHDSYPGVSEVLSGGYIIFA